MPAATVAAMDTRPSGQGLIGRQIRPDDGLDPGAGIRGAARLHDAFVPTLLLRAHRAGVLGPI
ncbi:hypothetical protein ABWJ92_37345 [Streptomyces sp. NPDC000609]|uniref:hypothetical protein n=1 Tax=Streptomyces sp. NPDC000609 TaxID=3160957 RepID=UPI003399C350